jgi:hypothetical protein
MWKTLGSFWAQMAPFAYILPLEIAQIHCSATGLTLFRRPYREDNGVQILATLRSMAINALRLDGIWSITEGIAALAHVINGLLKLLGWRPAAGTH